MKQEIHSLSWTSGSGTSGSGFDDGLIGKLITAASRAFDRRCTGVVDANNYFASETIANERLEGQVNYDGSSILCYPHKPIVTAVSSFTFRQNITTTLYIVPAANVDFNGPRVEAFPASMPLDFPSKCVCYVSYTGGLGATFDVLPDDLQEMVAILAARFYREAETGLTDQMGIAELGQLVYTKAWPIRVETQMLNGGYVRKVGWRHVA